MVSVAVSKLGCLQLIFVKLGSKVNEKSTQKDANTAHWL